MAVPRVLPGRNEDFARGPWDGEYRLGVRELNFWRQQTFRWLVLSVSCLALSGLLSLLLAVSRMPWLAALFTDPLIVRRALVVHVDLGVSVWFTAFPVAIFYWIQRDLTPTLFSKLVGQVSFWSAVAGISLFVVGGIFGGGEPILANYVPVVSNSTFLIGLGLYFVGCVLNFVDLRGLVALITKKDIRAYGVGAGVAYFLMALVAFLVAGVRAPQGVEGQGYFEMIMWAGGHALQFVNVCFLLVVWTEVWNAYFRAPVLDSVDARVIYGWLAFPLLIIPISLGYEISSAEHRESLTHLMRWGIFPPVLLYLVKVIPRGLELKRARSPRGPNDIRWIGVLLSAFMLVCGFIFGFLIRGPDLRIPGHYHAAIGAVSSGYALAAIWLFHEFNNILSPRYYESRIGQIQTWFYGIGQLVFGAGMVIAGSYGMARKVYGVEQTIAHPMQKVGMGVMGLGGLGAAIGGILFVVVLIKWFSKPQANLAG